jgi:hypothetical protein
MGGAALAKRSGTRRLYRKSGIAQPKPGDPRGRAQSATLSYFFFVPFFLAAFFFAGIRESPPLA